MRPEARIAPDLLPTDDQPAVFAVGDVLQRLGQLPEASVDLVLTSPPFLSLRSYLPADHPDKRLEGGSQATPGEFIDWLLDVVEACDRVLAPHGSLVIELGDTYSGSGGGGGDYLPGGLREGQPGFTGSAATARDAEAQRAANAAHWRSKNGGGKFGHVNTRREKIVDHNSGRRHPAKGWPLSKSLALVPELLRVALAYGLNPLTGRETEPWRVRNVVRWVRPNPAVGELADKFRPATSEILVACKSTMRYFDLDAVRRPSDYHRPNLQGKGSRRNGSSPPGQRFNASDHTTNPAGAPPLDWWPVIAKGYAGAHYAVWPSEICVLPIKSMAPERVCTVCGEPSKRVTEPTEAHKLHLGKDLFVNGDGTRTQQSRKEQGRGNPGARQRITAEYLTVGWTICGHGSWRPGRILDPFAGTFTTGAVAVGHGRQAIGIDLDERNAKLANDRLGPLFQWLRVVE